MNLSPNNEPDRGSYADAVPSVLRALDVLEYLGHAPDGLTLSELGRQLRISPSSLLAILRTLRNRGYIERDEPTRVYRPAGALARLSAESTDAALVREAAAAVTVLAQAMAVGPSARGGRQEALQALGLAARRLSTLLLDDEQPLAPVQTEPVWRLEASGPLGHEELDRFLDGAPLAMLSCLNEDGYPHSVPVWFHREQGRFWVVSRARAEWARYLDLDPRVSLAISESDPPLRRALIQGRAEPVEGPGSGEWAGELAALMASRYLGAAAPQYLAVQAAQPGRAFAIVPEKVVTWRGLASHPRYRPGGPPGKGGVEVA